ncbi:CAP domain-containing protein [Arthrobacter sp. efr-133-TYG-120]|uniref:CAP domain-containing protein n=1 Tax=Arthrobacter sp. efr-133-TYG-120 TaxID=3040280 RepID=UPI00254EA0A2|nr:CAP domain-containing protein [Arthrobacter sp. efr-133-TYG-120]
MPVAVVVACLLTVMAPASGPLTVPALPSGTAAPSTSSTTASAESTTTASAPPSGSGLPQAAPAPGSPTATPAAPAAAAPAQAAPAAAGTASTVQAAASPAQASPPVAPGNGTSPQAAAGPPPVPSIPPASGPDPLPGAAGDVPPPDPAPAPTKSSPAAVPLVSAQALVNDDNSAQVLAVFNAINAYRTSLGLNPVKYNPTVSTLSQDWSNNIASRQVIEHRPNFWTDPRALNPNNGAGEVIAVRWDRDAAQLVEWWKSSPAHDALLRDPRFNVIGVGITFTDGNYQTTPNSYTMWGVVNLFGYTTLPAGTVNSPGAGTAPPQLPPPTVCDPIVKHEPPTLDLSAAAIRSAGDLVAVDPSGNLRDYPALGNGTFGPARTVGTGFAGAKEVMTTDWDRDGVIDVLVQMLDGRLLLYPGVASGGFKAPVVLGLSGWQSMTMAVGIWCGNNRLPQILAIDSSGALYLYRNVGLTAMVGRTQVGTGVTAIRLSMVDYDADGFQDLLAVEANGNLRLYRGSGLTTPKSEARLVVGTGWTDYSGLRSLNGVTGLNTTGIAGLLSNGTIEYWDLTGGRLTTPSTPVTGLGGLKLAQ